MLAYVSVRVDVLARLCSASVFSSVAVAAVAAPAVEGIVVVKLLEGDKARERRQSSPVGDHSHAVSMNVHTMHGPRSPRFP